MTWVSPVEGSGRPVDLAALAAAPETGKGTKSPLSKSAETTNALGFGELLDIVNPLQHIPLISNVYRAVTKDQISDGARFAGHALYGIALGGPIGLSAMVGYSIGEDAVRQMAAAKAGPDNAPRPDTPSDVPLVTEDPVDGSRSIVTAPLDAAPIPKPNLVLQPEHVLGGRIGQATDRLPGDALDLTALLTDVSLTPPPKVDREIALGNTVADPAELAPDQKIDVIAAHSANRLPLDVLKVLQERHASRIASEQS